jgi:1,4-dihydroxy-2-naphthoyl-CoA synthase
LRPTAPGMGDADDLALADHVLERVDAREAQEQLEAVEGQDHPRRGDITKESPARRDIDDVGSALVEYLAAVKKDRQIALGADIRIAAPDMRFSILEIKWGLIPDVGITQTLRNIVSLDVAKELTFTGRILDGPAAKALGLVTHVSEEPLAQALELADEIASKSPDAIRSGKRLLDEAWFADERTGLELEATLQKALLGSPNQIESIKANFEKRAPNFSLPD